MNKWRCVRTIAAMLLSIPLSAQVTSLSGAPGIRQQEQAAATADKPIAETAIKFRYQPIGFKLDGCETAERHVT